ncbi:MAG: magnesium transporter CorA family protein, partial [Candidatus Omnitrophota bacterium]
MYETFLYQDNGELLTKLTPVQMQEALKDENSILWVDIKEPNDADVELLTSVFKLHPLTIEDCIMPNARPKLEKFNSYHFLIMHVIELHPEQKEEIRTIELDFCLGKNFLVSVHSDYIGALESNKERVRKESPMITKGADFLMSSVVDSLVDSYFPIINMFDDRVDDMSDELFRDPTEATLNKIYKLKNEVMFLRRTVGLQADVINLILRGGSSFIESKTVAYFRDVYDNLVRLNDIIGTSRDIIASALETYVSVVSNRLNEIMKTLTVIATIVMP